MATNNKIERIKKAAHVNYKKLKNPKTCSLKDYVDYYVKEELTTDYIYKTYPKKNISDPTNTNPLAITINKYLKILPLGAQSSHAYLWKGIYKTLKEKDESYVQRLYYPFLKKAENPYVEIVKARNNLTNKKSPETFVENFSLETYKISIKEYKYFLENKDKVVKFCQKEIPKVKLPIWFYSQFNNTPCFLCLLPTFPQVDFPNGVIDLVAKEYPILEKFKHKIKIKKGGITSTEYVKKTDGYVIRLDKNLNTRHKTVNLIHELSHVVAILEKFDILLEGKYRHELEAIKIELSILKKWSPKLYREKMANMLTTLYLVSFEIETYKNPDQDLPALYAKIVNQHFPKSKQSKNYTYLINENFITHPLRNLPHAMAYVKLLA
jgi:hypothetical protein